MGYKALTTDIMKLNKQLYIGLIIDTGFIRQNIFTYREIH